MRKENNSEDVAWFGKGFSLDLRFSLVKKRYFKCAEDKNNLIFHRFL